MDGVDARFLQARESLVEVVVIEVTSVEAIETDGEEGLAVQQHRAVLPQGEVIRRHLVRHMDKADVRCLVAEFVLDRDLQHMEIRIAVRFLGLFVGCQTISGRIGQVAALRPLHGGGDVDVVQRHLEAAPVNGRIIGDFKFDRRLCVTNSDGRNLANDRRRVVRTAPFGVHGLAADNASQRRRGIVRGGQRGFVAHPAIGKGELDRACRPT